MCGGCVYWQAGARTDVYNFWSDAIGAADLIYNPKHFAGAYINHNSSVLYGNFWFSKQIVINLFSGNPECESEYS